MVYDEALIGYGYTNTTKLTDYTLYQKYAK